MTVTVTANKPLFRAMLYWKFPNVERQYGGMTRTGNTATKTLNSITRPSVTWWVALTATDGSRFTSSKVTEDNPCS